MNNELGTYLYEDNIQNLFLGASQKLYNAVSHTIGPEGTNTAIPTGNDFLSIINDGKTIIETISSNNLAEKLAINTLKESAFATNKESGDGTSSTIILQHKLLEAAVQSPEKITANDILEARDLLLEELPKYKKEIASDEDLKKVITVALGSNKYTDIVFNAFEGLDKTQKPALVKVNTQKDTDFIKVDGISLAPVEVNPVVLKSMSLANDEPLDIIILNQEISRIDNAFAMLLKNISKSSKKTILLYTDIKPSVLDQLLFNIQEGTLNLIPVRLAMNIQNLDDIISDLEDYFGCKAYSDLNPYQTNITPTFVGKGIGYILNKDSVIIKNDNEEHYKEREHILPSVSSAIQVGFITYSQQAEDYRRLEDAIQSAYNAINYGYVIGAGFMYFSMCNVIPDKSAVLRTAMCNIFESLCSAADFSSQLEFINSIENNVYDSYKVAEQVILNAFTVVSQILSTRCLLVPYQRNRMTGIIE